MAYLAERVIRESSTEELTILIIEDDSVVRNWLTELLVKEKYRVFETDNAVEARQVSASCEGAIHLIIASANDDNRIVAEIQSLRPSSRVLWISNRPRVTRKGDNSVLLETEFLPETLVSH